MHFFFGVFCFLAERGNLVGRLCAFEPLLKAKLLSFLQLFQLDFLRKVAFQPKVVASRTAQAQSQYMGSVISATFWKNSDHRSSMVVPWDARKKSGVLLNERALL